MKTHSLVSMISLVLALIMVLLPHTLCDSEAASTASSDYSETDFYDSCFGGKNCSTCLDSVGCGWCDSVSKCASGNRKGPTRGSCPSGWYYDSCGNTLNDTTIQWNALTDFYWSFNGNSWTSNSGWLNNSSYCNWYGVTCDVRGNVISIYLPRNQLSGTIPSSLGQLKYLQSLSIYRNDLRGDVPSSLGQLSYLTDVELSWNSQLSGNLSWLAPLKNLKTIYLGKTQLSGPLPSLQQFNSLQTLDIGYSQLTRISSWMTQPPQLYSCYLGGNPLQCPIPSWAQTKCSATCS